MQVWKTEVKFDGGTVEMPEGARPLYFNMQHGANQPELLEKIMTIVGIAPVLKNGLLRWRVSFNYTTYKDFLTEVEARECYDTLLRTI